MKSALQNLSYPEEQPSQPARRKLSLFPEFPPQWEQSIEMHDLKKLGNYINSNIQSERKNILQLYSTSFCTLHRSQRPLLPELLSNAKKTLRRRSAKETFETLSPSKANCSQEMENDRDFIVSNRFPNKFIKTTEKLSVSILAKHSPPKTVKKVVQLPPKSSQSKTEKLLPHIPREEARRRLPKLLKSKSNEEEANQLNPWQYLQMQEEPAFNFM